MSQGERHSTAAGENVMFCVQFWLDYAGIQTVPTYYTSDNKETTKHMCPTSLYLPGIGETFRLN